MKKHISKIKMWTAVCLAAVFTMFSASQSLAAEEIAEVFLTQDQQLISPEVDMNVDVEAAADYPRYISLTTDASGNIVMRGSTINCICTVEYNSGIRKIVTPNWSISSGTSYASITSGGVVTGKAEGAATVKASYTEGGTTVTGTLYVYVAELSSITISGATTVYVGNTANYSCTASYSIAYNVPDKAVTPTWSISSGGTYASITSGGILTALSPGSVTVKASYSEGGVTKTVTKSVTVTSSSVTLSSISISGKPSVNAGSSVTYICNATYSNGTTKTVTATWSISSGGTYASITIGGILTALSPGSVTVKASYSEGGVTKTVTKSVTVISGGGTGVPKITTQPKSQTVNEGSSVTFSVVAEDPGSGNADFTIPLSGNVNLDMIWIEPGTFLMGSPEDELGRDSDETQHQVTLTQGYWLGKYEVTQAQYEAVMGKNPSWFKGVYLPVEQVSWYNAMDFCAKLTAAEKAAGRLPEGYGYTLPTEAQWEYACRAGTTTALNSGKNLSDKNKCPEMNEVGWYVGNSDGTHSVGQKKPNVWGLYDMHGNVWEWCLDWYGAYPASSVTDPTGAGTGSARVLRGGAYAYTAPARICRSAARGHYAPSNLISDCGFRVALAPVRSESGSFLSYAEQMSEVLPEGEQAENGGPLAASGAMSPSRTAVAAADTLTYQWYKDGVAISGATGSSYTIRSVKSSDAGKYTVKVSNSAGSVTSNAATLTVVKNKLTPRIIWNPVSPITYGTLLSEDQLNAVAVGPDGEPVDGSYIYTVNSTLPSVGVHTLYVAFTPFDSNYEEVTASVTVTVTAPVTLSSITISGSDSVNVGSTTTYSCTATYSDGTSKTVTPNWSVSPTTYASITGGGVLTGKAAGTATVKAEFTDGGVTKTATKSVTVNASFTYHPADTDKDKMIKITEVTAYGKAWKNGETWSVAPNPIPISYLTRAGALWKGGETYYQDKTQETPLCWVNELTLPVSTMPFNPIIDFPIVILEPEAEVEAAASSPAVSTISGTKVTINVTPDAGVFVYAVEDTLPSGWTVTGINENGVFDSVNRKVKWGPWFDNSPRTLTYTLVVPSGFSGTATLSGTASFDGVDTAITGDRQYGKSASSGKAVSKISGNQVTITVTPGSGVSVYAAEDKIPSGLTVTGINENGVFDSVNRKVKWGPWFDNSTRTLTYTLVPGSFTGTATLSGTASFDGVDAAITGDRQYTVSSAVKPSITAQPKSQTVNEGASVTFSVTAAGTATLKYQWKKNGTAISGATSSSYKISSVKSSDAGSYTVTVSNSAGSVTSSAATLTVNVPVTLSSISISGNASVNVGSTATYTCKATYSNGTTKTVTPTWSISSGSTYASISSSGVLTGKATGTATVKASYSEGGVTKTATKNVTVNSVPVTLSSISISGNDSVNVGSTANYTCKATYSNGTTKTVTPTWSISSGSSYASITSGGVLTGRATGTATVKASYTEGGVTKTTTKAVSITTPVSKPTITTQPKSQTVTEGSSVTFSVTATGTATLKYQWKKNGTAISGATSSSYKISSVKSSDAGSYTVTVSNSAGSVTSSTATLTVNAAVVISSVTINGNASVNVGSTATYTCTVKYSNGTSKTVTPTWSISAGETCASITSGGVLTGKAAGTVTVKASYTEGGQTKVVTKSVTVNAAVVKPTITTQPKSQTVTEGDPVTFSVVASGTTPLSYQWKKNGSNISGATGSTYKISSAKTSDAGSYTITVSNSAGSVTSSEAKLTVSAAVVKPSITTQPKSQTVTEGDPVTFSVVASGTTPLSYQWKKNGSNISGATGSTYKISSAKTSDAGSYTVTVSNSAGSVTSSAATLTVNAVITLNSIRIYSNGNSLTIGKIMSLICKASYSDGTSKTVTPIWSISSGIDCASITDEGTLTGESAGTVEVKATYTEGGVTKTATVTITIVDADVTKPAITTQPKSQTVNEGDSVTFSVTATGTAPLSYQWKKNGSNISGATGSTYKISSTKTSDAGSYTVTVSNSAGSVTSSAATLTVKQGRVEPMIIWNTPAAITYGTALSENQLNAAADVPGTFVYDPPIGTVLNVGTHTLNVTFTPKDSTNYTTTTESVELVVNRASPVISWTSPDPITYGTALSENQLNATANIPGTFVYDPAIGTVLNVGTQILTVVFTPESTNYDSVLATVKLVVTEAPSTITIQRSVNVTGNKATVTLTVSDAPKGYFGSLEETWQNKNVTFSAISNEGTASGTEGGMKVIWSGFDMSGNYQFPGKLTYTATVPEGTSATVTLSGKLVITTTTGVVEADVTGTTSVTFTVPPSVPVIVKQLESKTVSEGSSVTLGLTVTGSEPLVYQWFKNSSLLSGVNGSSYTIPSVTSSDAGIYMVMISNAQGAVMSALATLTVTQGEVPTLSIQKDGRKCLITFTGTLQESTDMKSWKNVTGTQNGGYAFTPAKGKKFYRAVK